MGRAQVLAIARELRNPEGNRGLPARTTPGAMKGVNFGGGPRASKDARGSSARRHGENTMSELVKGLGRTRRPGQTALIGPTLPSSPP
jgi:hypothetical protein